MLLKPPTPEQEELYDVSEEEGDLFHDSGLAFLQCQRVQGDLVVHVISVKEDARRTGVARSIMRRLRAEHPGLSIVANGVEWLGASGRFWKAMMEEGLVDSAVTYGDGLVLAADVAAREAEARLRHEARPKHAVGCEAEGYAAPEQEDAMQHDTSMDDDFDAVEPDEVEDTDCAGEFDDDPDTRERDTAVEHLELLMGDAQQRMELADAGDLDPGDVYRIVFAGLGWSEADIEEAVANDEKSLEGQLWDHVGSKAVMTVLVKDALAKVEDEMLLAAAAPRP